MASLSGLTFQTFAGAQYDVITDSSGRAYYRDNRTGQVIGPIDPNGYVQPKLREYPVEKREMPVVGYRGWMWDTKYALGRGKRGTLVSTGVKSDWKGVEKAASCQATPNPYLPTPTLHTSPDPNCGCGLYVLADMDELEKHVAFTDAMIVGAVVGWGKVVQHGTEGWRAQYCRILALLDCKFSDAQLAITRDAAQQYDLPILERDGLERYVREWGDPFQEPASLALPPAPGED